MAGLLAGLLAASITAARAQDQPAPANPPAPSASPTDTLTKEKSGHEQELKGVQDTLQASEEQRKKIEAEVESIKADRARLNAALIDTAAKVHAAEAKVNDADQRLATLTGSEEAIRHSLEGRRDVIAQILAALQRMGRKPPPAVLARPEDMLSAIHTSMLLGAVLPEMRKEIEDLTSDLSELVRLRANIANERDGRTKDLASLNEEQAKLNALVAARQQSLNEAEQALSAEQARAADLAKQATSLKDLISKMETQIASASQAAEAARQSDADQRRAEAAGLRSRLAAAPFKDPARLAPALPFAETKGLLPMPVSGTLLKAYGAPDGFGGQESGISVGVRPGASVSAPSDGWVAFSGPYRTYGQLLIINAGGGYYIVLAGMEKINVNVGQFVLAGEPVATMGDGSARTAAAIAIGAAQPILYIEFRKDGAAIDPGPWWAKADLEKVRG
ncbi:murein hydrolase activator EnvC family protein [Methylovirgula sp. 4M-Z18]|uniref:murein hydrolase activator EnvC family protein n=1 Tax=Methylovirgula sp. 4M-Z18 TaxID=2293567 RepID=UPI000E2E647B|nr:peptidoglycan DD-metalloendopeptidase family protein [Methylovirgula sp. 4M-Z18]RFB78760.1 hypothetical protein DYH55_15720 [Methylovirgula sp. 4M-Z18]